MTAVLGLSAFYHDSAAALVVDGDIVAAAQEERFTRKKHDAGFPSQAVGYCLREAGLRVEDIDWVGFYDKPLLKLDRLVETWLAHAPLGLAAFSKALPQWTGGKLFLPRQIRRELGLPKKRPIAFAEHHESHAASAFFPSPFEEAALLTMDGVGEWATASLGVGRGTRIDITQELAFPHSLGLLYSAFTYHCGFKVSSGEYKLMGLAPYGEPRFAGVIREKLMDLREDGSFRLDLSYFGYCAGLTMTTPRFDELFGGPARKSESPLTQREMDLAASIQAVTEEVVLRMGRHLHRTTKLSKLCMAGGVALNCVANGRLLREGPFDEIFVQPAAGDAGGALGMALLLHHQLLGNPRKPVRPDAQHGSLLGPSFTDEEIEATLRAHGATWRRIDDDAALTGEIARRLADGAVVGWFAGRMEFGPRALGSRSIIGDPRNTSMQAAMNLKIKFRESFRPFAPAVLAREAHSWFALDEGQASPYMLMVAPVRSERLLPVPPEAADLFGIERLRIPRSEIPAVTHVDMSARVQTVDARNGRFFALLEAFERLTGCPVLVNTSFNVRGEPICCRPEEALRCFRLTEMDILVLEHCVLVKSEQPPVPADEAARYRSLFDPD